MVVGAAMGDSSVLVKQLRPAARIFAVDALPRHETALRATLVLNALAPTDVTVMPIAVSPETGQASFVDNAYGSHLSSAAVNRPGAVELEVEARSRGFSPKSAVSI